MNLFCTDRSESTVESSARTIVHRRRRTAILFMFSAFSSLFLSPGCGDEFGILLKNLPPPVQSDIQATPVSYTYGNIWTGRFTETTITVSNSCDDAVVINSTILSDEDNYDIISYPVSPIIPGSSTTLTVRFEPDSVGIKPCSISIAHNRKGSPLVINVSGTGIGEILWTETDKTINCINRDGSGRHVLLTTSGTPLDIDIYMPDEQIYWTEYTGSGTIYQIRMADIDGSGENLFYGPSGLSFGPSAITIDHETGTIYWNEYNTTTTQNDIWRSTLSGFSATQWVKTLPFSYSYSICLDTTNNKIYGTTNSYWDIYGSSGSGNTGVIFDATIDTGALSLPVNGSGPSGNSSALRGIAADNTGTTDYIFYVNNDASGNKTIRRALSGNLNTSSEWIPSGSYGIQKIALDLTDRKIYWTSAIDNSIYRADLDTANSHIERFLTLDSKPNGIVVVP